MAINTHCLGNPSSAICTIAASLKCAAFCDSSSSSSSRGAATSLAAVEAELVLLAVLVDDKPKKELAREEGGGVRYPPMAELGGIVAVSFFSSDGSCFNICSSLVTGT